MTRRKSTSNYTLNDAYELFILDNQARRLTKSTQAFYTEKLRAFLQWLDVSLLSEVTSKHIRLYLIYMQERGLKPNSQNDHARAVKTFFNFAVKEGLITHTPFENVKTPQAQDVLAIVLSEEEARTVIQKTLDQRNRLIVRFILDSGVRASELLALNVGDVDMQTGVVVVRLGKQQKGRLTSIGATTRKELKKYLLQRIGINDEQPLFVTSDRGTRPTLVALMHVFRKIRKETGIDKVTAHTLRRTMATLSLLHGMDAYTLARMLGHADLQVLRKYAEATRNLIIQNSEKYSIVDNL